MRTRDCRESEGNKVEMVLTCDQKRGNGDNQEHEMMTSQDGTW